MASVRTEEMVMSSGTHVLDRVGLLVRDPYSTLVARWNWKSSLFSSLCRGGVFFAANATAGMDAALGAIYAEFLYRSVTAGFYGAITQHFSVGNPRWLANTVAALGIPLFSHTIELGIHWARHTPNLRSSITASVIFTVVSTLFNLHAMRHGVLTVGDGSRSITADLKLLPRVVAAIMVPHLAPRRQA